MILTTIAIVAQVAPAASAAPAKVDVAVTAKAWLISLQHGKMLDASALESEMAALLTPATLSALATQLGPLGDPIAFTQKKTGSQGDTTYYVYDAAFIDKSHWNFLILFDKAGKISGMQATPAQ